MKGGLYKILVALLIALSLSSCVQEEMEFAPVPEGMADVEATVSFTDFSVTSLRTKAVEGDAVKGIEDLHVLVYKQEGEELVLAPANPSRGFVNPMKVESFISKTDTEAKFRMHIPSGTYHIYAVANMGDDFLTEYSAAIATASGLKKIQVDWKEDIVSNNSMMGVFHPVSAMGSPASTDDVPITLSSGNIPLHSWLRRTVSKLTVAFNTDRLNDNTWIFLKKVTVKSTAPKCYLWDKNDPNCTGGPEMTMVEEGDRILYCDPSDDIPAASPELQDPQDRENSAKWPSLTNRSGTYGSHEDNALSMFFFENMQGDGPDKTPEPGVGFVGPGDDRYMDTKRSGTYVEVEAYYRSNARGNEGEGRIVYRFMLGANVTTDYNVARNTHYQLTLAFRGNANEVDWHIEYTIPDEPKIYAPHPFYISYMYGESVTLPITFKGLLKEGTAVIAEIVENNWAPMDEAGVDHWTGEVWTGANGSKSKKSEPWFGFLSLCNSNIEDDNVGMNIASTTNSRYSGNEGRTVYLMDYWKGNKSAVDAEEGGKRIPPQGRRVYYTSRTSRTFDLDANGDATLDPSGNKRYNGQNNPHGGTNGRYEYLITDNGGVKRTHLYIPIYTRALFLVTSTGYSGNNPFYSSQRKARVAFTYTLDDNIERTDTVEVIQVRRIINPKGIYRRAGNNTPFHVTLSHRVSETATNFQPFASEGKWSAEIESGDINFINLNGRQRIDGATGSNIDFMVNFVPTASRGNRYAVILVRYHDNTCFHRIYVRQGYDPDYISEGGCYWHCYNLRGAKYTAAKGSTPASVTGYLGSSSPLEEGSLFKYNNFDDAIDASEQKVSDRGVYISPDRKFKMVDENGNLKAKSKGWAEIKYGTAKDNVIDFNDNSAYRCTNISVDYAGRRRVARLPLKTDFDEFRSKMATGYGFGVCYDDDATRTHMEGREAFDYLYSNHELAPHGMRGCFIYHKTTGKNFFFPAGAAATGRRKDFRNGNSSDHASAGLLRYANRNVYFPTPTVCYMPMFYTIKDNLGAIYWMWPFTEVVDGRTQSNTAWDMNVSTFDYNGFGGNAAELNGSACDACFIRLVETPEQFAANEAAQ